MTKSLRKERGDAGKRPDLQEAELPIGPMREAIVETQSVPQEEDTVAADRAEAERRQAER